MHPAELVKTRGIEDAGATFMARLLGNSGAAITQASLSAVTYKVFNRSDAEVATGTVTIGSAVFDALQTADAAWLAAGGSATGYNFKHTLPASAFPLPGRYRVEYLFDPASGENFWLRFDHEVAAVLTSYGHMHVWVVTVEQHYANSFAVLCVCEDEEHARKIAEETPDARVERFELLKPGQPPY